MRKQRHIMNHFNQQQIDSNQETTSWTFQLKVWTFSATFLSSVSPLSGKGADCIFEKGTFKFVAKRRIQRIEFVLGPIWREEISFSFFWWTFANDCLVHTSRAVNLPSTADVQQIDQLFRMRFTSFFHRLFTIIGLISDAKQYLNYFCAHFDGDLYVFPQWRIRFDDLLHSLTLRRRRNAQSSRRHK